MKNNKGFTLVELLVVIAIIGILAGVVLIAINPAALMMKARDSQRLQDMDTVHKALGLALADGEINLVDTSTTCGADGCDSITYGQAIDGSSGWVQFSIPTGKEGLSKYLATLPVDPTNDAATDPLYYVFASTPGDRYELNAHLESTDNTDKMSTDGGDSNTRFEIGTDLNILTDGS